MRPTMTCDLGVVAGARKRPTERAVSTTSLTACCGWRTAFSRLGTTDASCCRVKSTAPPTSCTITSRSIESDVTWATGVYSMSSAGSGSLLEVEQVGGELHRPDAVGDDVVRLHHERRLSSRRRLRRA